jgi:ParB family chromosome partitioning protein
MTEGKKTLEELAQEMDLDLRQIPVSDLVPDPENANEMDDDLYEALIADIRDQGFTQPILVRREGDHYKIIDGEHRWRAVAEVGYANIPAVVIDADDDEATIRSLTMNRFRGKFIPIRLAHVITVARSSCAPMSASASRPGRVRSSPRPSKSSASP